MDNYGEKPKFNNFGGGNPIEEHSYAVGRDSKVLNSYDDSNYNMGLFTNVVSMKLKHTNQKGYDFGCAAFSKDRIDDKFGFNDKITNSMM